MCMYVCIMYVCMCVYVFVCNNIYVCNNSMYVCMYGCMSVMSQHPLTIVLTSFNIKDICYVVTSHILKLHMYFFDICKFFLSASIIYNKVQSPT